MDVTEIYTDGGVIRSNPSPIGGTWAWCLIDADGNRCRSESGIILPIEMEMESASNNVTELLAALYALEELPRDWTGTLWTDSAVTRSRLMSRATTVAGLPHWMQSSLKAARRTREFKIQLCAGHPTMSEIRNGKARRNGLPVSRHNIWCDELCQMEARKYMRKLELEKR